MQRSKTQRRRGPATPGATAGDTSFVGDSVVKATEDSLDALFAAETMATFNQPWQKLDRGSRLDRLRRYVQGYPTLTPAERASLLTAILQAFEAKQLNTKLAVDYDPVTATILSIRGLKERITPAGLRVFRIDLSVATRTTQKQKKATTSLNTVTPDKSKDE
jgi:hypothetical protein